MIVNGINGLSTSQVSVKIGVKVSAETLKQLGNQPLMETHIGKYWREDDIPQIIDSLIGMLSAKKIEIENGAGE